MNLLWERFAGQTAKFAVRMSLHEDPHPVQGSDDDTSASWGAIQIWLDGVNICASTDQGESLASAHWYLLPILEWFVEQWDPLLHEERLPLERFVTAADFSASPNVDFDTDDYWEREEQRFAWSERHGIRSAADGGLLPDLKIRRLRDEIEFSWSRTPIAGADEVEWQAPAGISFADPNDVAEVLFEVIDSCSAQLLSIRPESERLRALRTRVRAIEDFSRTEVRTAWLAGLGQTVVAALNRWHEVIGLVSAGAAREAIQATFGPSKRTALVVGGSSQAALLFGSASPTLTDSDALKLAGELLAAYAPRAQSGLDDHLHEEPLDASVQPWLQGYDLAEELLEDYPNLIVDNRLALESFLSGTGVNIAEAELQDESLRAVSFAGESHTPTILINSSWDGNRSPGGRRFTLAHELCHLLFDRSFGTELAVASGPWAPLALEQRANAFAAMLLMPPSILRNVDSVAPFKDMTKEQLVSVSQKIGVSFQALLEHLYNVGLLNEFQRAKLRILDHS